MARNSIDRIEDTYEGREFICPYYRWHSKKEGGFSLHCEAGKINIPDNPSRRKLIYGYCAHPTGWKECSIAEMLTVSYEQK